jgi:hypothetical protein
LSRTATVAEDGTYSINYIAPDHEWQYQLLNGTEVLYEETISVEFENVVKDVEI